MRTRFFCCRIFGISNKCPRDAGRAMLAEVLSALSARTRHPPGKVSPIRSQRGGGGLRHKKRPAEREPRGHEVRLPRRARGLGGADGPRSYTRRVEKRAWGRRLAWSTAIFSLATGLSRILGLVREIVAAYYFGAAGKINAFTVAFQVPNLVRSLVADAALSSAFVPVFSELLEKGDRKRAWRVASSLFWLMLLGLGALTALFMLIAPWLISIFGNPGGDRAHAVGLSRVLFPIVALLGVSGIVVGILNSYEHFSVPALTPVFWNLAIIAGLAIGVPQTDSTDTKLYIYAASILVGTVIQVLLPIP